MQHMTKKYHYEARRRGGGQGIFIRKQRGENFRALGREFSRLKNLFSRLRNKFSRLGNPRGGHGIAMS